MACAFSTSYYISRRITRASRPRCATGAEYSLRADYLLATDGANSAVRQALRAPTNDWGSLGHYPNVYFEADLTESVRGREFSMSLVQEPGLTGFLLALNNRNRWARHPRYDPSQGTQPANFTEPVR